MLQEIKWTEPKTYIELKIKSDLSNKTLFQILKGPLLAFLIMLIVLMASHYSTTVRSNDTLAIFLNSLLFNAVGSASFVMLISVLARYAHWVYPPGVKLQGNRLLRATLSPYYIKYNQVDSFRINHFSCKRFSCDELILKFARKRSGARIGIDPKLDAERIKHFLIDAGLKCQE
ncbi:MAG: hypothetical protein AAGA40_06615 [Cyanobacteria bacterium P01_E01_bin.45]